MNKSNNFDTTYLVETPESIDLSAKLAGPFVRVMAFTIDFFIRAIILLVLAFVLALLAGTAGWGLFLIVAFLLEWFYPVLFEVLRGGQTPGKKYLNIVVVNDDLKPVTWSTSFIRNLLRSVDFLPFAYCFGLISLALTQNFQRLGDMAAGSLVIYKTNNQATLDDLPNVSPLPPSMALSIDEQFAITEFSRRSESLSAARKIELAEILSPLEDKKGEEAVKNLHGISRWLLGDRG